MERSSTTKQCVLVTGGAGFIGSHVVERLLASGRYRVVVVDDFNDFYAPQMKRANLAGVAGRDDFELVEADILDEERLRSVFERNELAAVVHLAARAGVRPSLREPLLYQRVNVEGTYRLLDLAHTFGVGRFLFASSSSVYGARSRVPFRESDPCDRPASPYAATKIAGECACYTYSELYGIRTLCLRYFTVYGPRQRPDLAIRKFTELLASGRPVPLYGDGSTSRDYTFVDDVVDAVERALDYSRSRFEVINIGGERPVPLRRLVDLLAGALGVTARIERLPEQPGDVPLTCADGTLARELLGFEPAVGIEEGIDRFVGWYRERLKTEDLGALLHGIGD